MRIAHMGDTHLGYRALGRSDPETGRNQRAVDVERAFERVIDDVLARQVDLVIHAGDAFHSTRPSWNTLGVFVRQLRRIEAAGIPCLVIGGNHDTPRLRQSGSVFDLLALALPEIHFAAGYEVDEWTPAGLATVLHSVPHGALVNPTPPVVYPIPGVRNIVVTHGMAPGMQQQFKGVHEAGEARLSPDVLDPGADYVALGHFHAGFMVSRNAYYSGSTERTGWGDEAVKPGYNIVTLGQPGEQVMVEHIELPTRPMRTLAAIDGAGVDADELAGRVLDRAGAYGDPEAMVRIELLGVPRPVRREVESLIRRDLNDVVWDLRVFSAADVLDSFAAGGDETLPPLRTLFEGFVEERRAANVYDDRFATLFLTSGLDALDRAREQTRD